MENNSVVKVSINPEFTVDTEEMERLTQLLRRELLDLDSDIESVKPAIIDKAPTGSKVVEPFSWGTLLLALAASGGVLTTLITAIQSWLLRRGSCSVTLEIGGDKLQITGISSEDQKRLINEWINRHSKGSKP